MTTRASEVGRPRREYGSEFPWFSPGEHAVAPSSPPWLQSGELCGSGRDALRLLLSHGRETRGWRRLLVPEYFCQDVVESMKGELPVAVYKDGPGRPSLDVGAIPAVRGDVVLLVNYFGLRGARDVVGRLADGVESIEDHTHDPWSRWALGSAADWCIASLRKTLPVPDGGVAWSPRAHALPRTSGPTENRRTASLEKLAGMVLKRAYLDGAAIDKDAFRGLLDAGEKHIADGAISLMPQWTRAMLPTFPATEWRAQRMRNHLAFTAALGAQDWVRVMQPAREDDACAFSVMLVVDSRERRSRLRERLIAERIYPAVLWSLESHAVEGISDAALDLSRRILSLHCDARYSVDDMAFVAERVARLGSSARA